MGLTKMIDTVLDLMNGFHKFKQEVRLQTEIAVKKIQRQMMLTLIEASMYIAGAVLVLVAVIMFLSRFFHTEYVLLIMGAIILYVGVLIKNVR